MTRTSRTNSFGSGANIIFIVGSPRSGTTWLQLLLAQHPDIATDKETQLFTQYVSRLQERWHEEVDEAQVGTTNGLTQIMTETQFLTAVRGFTDRVLGSLAKDNPTAKFVLEKSPEHALHASTIMKAYPDAWFLHIIRDPRAVSNSFRHAARDWWTWAPSGPIETTRRWRRNVSAARDIASFTSRYNEVFYEDLHRSGEDELRRLLSWLGLAADDDFCREAIKACHIENLKDGQTHEDQPWELDEEPDGFFRVGNRDSWRDELTRCQISTVEQEARGLMCELGYDLIQSRYAGRYMAALRLRLYQALKVGYNFCRMVAHSIDWRLKRLLSRL